MFKIIFSCWVEDTVDPSTGEVIKPAHWERNEGSVRKEQISDLLQEYADDILNASREGCSFFMKECGEKSGPFKPH